MSALLAPFPRRLTPTGGTLRLSSVLLLPAMGPPEAEHSVDRLEAGLARVGIGTRHAAPGSRPRPAETPLRLRLVGNAPPSTTANGQSYELEVTTERIEITAPRAAGLFHGAETLLQLLAEHSPREEAAPVRLPTVRIEDRPGFAHRGLMLDVSRNRVPNLDSLLRLVDTMAALKLNQLQLYTEHTFAYRGHEIVWQDASPLTADEIRTLDAHCRRRFVELVPNQNSFGHLHRWLRHEPYRQLAELPEGMAHPFGEEREPFSLCPIDPGAIDLLRDLYGQLLPQFTSRQLNVGCDETFDLGKGRSAEACRKLGSGHVYLDFLRQLHALAADHGRRLQFWGDILAGKPELLREVPADAVALDWGYEAGHPFDQRASALADAGLEFYLCPGTSSWNSFAGRLDNALANLAEAARAGAEHGASGYLITDWGDFGHLQPPPVSWPGLLAGAVFAWDPTAAEAPDSLPLAELLDRYGEPGLAPGTGELLTELGNIYRRVGIEPMNASALFKLVNFAQRSLADTGLAELTIGGLDEADAAISSAADRLDSLDAASSTRDLVRRELSWVTEMLRFACDLGRARLNEGGEQSVAALSGPSRQRLAGELGRRIEELTPIWLARSRRGGLDDSLARLRRVRRLLA